MERKYLLESSEKKGVESKTHREVMNKITNDTINIITENTIDTIVTGITKELGNIKDDLVSEIKKYCQESKILRRLERSIIKLRFSYSLYTSLFKDLINKLNPY